MRTKKLIYLKFFFFFFLITLPLNIPIDDLFKFLTVNTTDNEFPSDIEIVNL